MERKDFFFGNGNKKTRSNVIYDDNGNAIAVVSVTCNGNYKNGNYALDFTTIDIADSNVRFAKDKSFTQAVKKVTRKSDGKDCDIIVFVENELLDGISTKWKQDKAIAACSEADEVSLLFKAVKADKQGNIWKALKGLKNDTERLAKLTVWCKKADWKKQAMEKYSIGDDAPEIDDAPAV